MKTGFVVSPWQPRLEARPRLTVDELAKHLEDFSLVRRRAIMFGLENQLPIADVVLLDWKAAFRVCRTELSRQILHAMPRHVKLDYAFWEELDSGQAAPLFCLERECREMQPSYNVLMTDYRSLALVDRDADLAAFKAVMP
jgi:hypothetical protein